VVLEVAEGLDVDGAGAELVVEEPPSELEVDLEPESELLLAAESEEDLGLALE
jgi:hypothetical protein